MIIRMIVDILLSLLVSYMCINNIKKEYYKNGIIDKIFLILLIINNILLILILLCYCGII